MTANMMLSTIDAIKTEIPMALNNGKKWKLALPQKNPLTPSQVTEIESAVESAYLSAGRPDLYNSSEVIEYFSDAISSVLVKATP